MPVLEGIMRERTLKARMQQKLAEEMNEPEKWLYLSFADEKFNGGVVIKAHGMMDAVTKTHALGINPGGQVISIEVPDEHLPDEKFRNRLLSKEDVLEMWPDSKHLREIWEEENEAPKKH
jgi:hypothetical protein